MTHKVCRGTDYGWGHSGAAKRRYEEYKRRYTNCTIVNGNLELVFLEDPPYSQYDLSFLTSIRSVLTLCVCVCVCLSVCLSLCLIDPPYLQYDLSFLTSIRFVAMASGR